MKEVFLSLGSNIGNKKKNIDLAISHLAKKTIINKVSYFYESSPTDYAKQKYFLNVCVCLETHMMIGSFFSFCRQIERKMKSVKKVFKGPRIIDIDILFYENLTLNRQDLIIPHPRYSERLFVLMPLYDVIPKNLEKNKIKNILETCIKIQFLGQKIKRK